MSIPGIETISAVRAVTVAAASLLGTALTGVVGAVGPDSSNTLAIGTTLGVSVAFAGLILRMVIKNQGAIWDIVRTKDGELLKKDSEIRQLKLEKEYTEWEREQARFRAKERTDPGPFTPSPSLTSHMTGTTTT